MAAHFKLPCRLWQLRPLLDLPATLPPALCLAVPCCVHSFFEFQTFEIQNSTVLWESFPPDIMDRAIKVHHAAIRGCLPEFAGFESATEGRQRAAGGGRRVQAGAEGRRTGCRGCCLLLLCMGSWGEDGEGIRECTFVAQAHHPSCSQPPPGSSPLNPGTGCRLPTHNAACIPLNHVVASRCCWGPPVDRKSVV